MTKEETRSISGCSVKIVLKAIRADSLMIPEPQAFRVVAQWKYPLRAERGSTENSKAPNPTSGASWLMLTLRFLSISPHDRTFGCWKYVVKYAFSSSSV